MVIGGKKKKYFIDDIIDKYLIINNSEGSKNLQYNQYNYKNLQISRADKKCFEKMQ
jgi:hypothetical protein